MYFNQLLLAARKAHVVYSDQLLGAAPCIHFISNHDSTNTTISKECKRVTGPKSGEVNNLETIRVVTTPGNLTVPSLGF